MSPEAMAALKGELACRRIEPSDTSSSGVTAEIAQPAPIAIATRSEAQHSVIRQGHSDRIRSQFWIFFQLSAAGAVAGYIVLAIRRYAAREVVSQLAGMARFPNVQVQLEISLLNLTTIYLIWIVTFLVFAATCSAVKQTKSGNRPSVHDSVLAPTRRPLACLRISLLLFLILLLAVVLTVAVGLGAWRVLERAHLRTGHFAFILQSSLVTFAGLLAFSRLVLAVPAVVLDGLKPGQAVFFSDESTEGKGGILALLLSKWLIAGYVAGTPPFSIRIWLWHYVQLPGWAATAASSGRSRDR